MGSDLKFSKDDFTGFLSGDIPLRHSDSNQPDVIKLDQLANSIPKLLLTNKIIAPIKLLAKQQTC